MRREDRKGGKGIAHLFPSVFLECVGYEKRILRGLCRFANLIGYLVSIGILVLIFIVTVIKW